MRFIVLAPLALGLALVGCNNNPGVVIMIDAGDKSKISPTK